MIWLCTQSSEDSTDVEFELLDKIGKVTGYNVSGE